MSRAKTIKEKPCFIYVDQEPLTSYRSILKKISSKDIKEKKEGLQTILGSMVNDDHYPSDLMIQAIHNLTIVDDIEIKKLLFLFWEVIEKTNSNGKIKDEFILVCNYLRKDLDSNVVTSEELFKESVDKAKETVETVTVVNCGGC